MGASAGVAGDGGGNNPYPEFPAAIPSEDFKDVALHAFFLQLRQQVFHMLQVSLDCSERGRGSEREGRCEREGGTVRARDSVRQKEKEKGNKSMAQCV